MDRETVQALLAQAVPFNRVLGIEVIEVEPGRVVARMPASPDRLNHVGTIHAAAQFGLGEATAGAQVVVAFGHLQAQGIVPLAVDAMIRYRRPASDDLRGVASLDQREAERVTAEALAGGRPRFIIPVQIMDATGQITTEMTVTWVLVKP
jgi:uncharacterized protein (TIGR00369 family)